MAKEKSILNFHQKKFLELFSQEKYLVQKFYLTGGTSLSEFYLKHRISEDLDFFSEEEIDVVPITKFLKINSNDLNLEKIETRRVLGLYSFFLHFKDKKILKVDFSYHPFPRIEKGKSFNKIEIDSIHDIAVNKVHTISTQPRARDFIDLYFIIKEKGWDFYDLLMKAKTKFDWDISAIDLGARLLEARKMTDYPRMLKKIVHADWKRFFIEEARKLKEKIFK